jgi:phosphate transporter
LYHHPNTNPNFHHRYDALKKYIYQLERQKFGDGRPYHDMEASEYATLLAPTRSDTDSLFIPLLNQELKKIVTFYESQEKELLEDVGNLEEHAAQLEEAGLAAGERYLDDDDDDDEDDDDSISHSPAGRRRSVSFRRLSRPRCECAPSPCTTYEGFHVIS